MLHAGPPSVAVGGDQALWRERGMTSPPAWVHRVKEDAYVHIHTNARANSRNSAPRATETKSPNEQ